MIHVYVFLLLGWFQPPPQGEALRSGCSGDDRQLGLVGVEDQVDVTQALAGGPQTCYRVTVRRAGQDVTQGVTGYVLGETHPAIEAFVRHRQEIGAASLEAQARLLAAPPKPAASDKNPSPAPAPENLPVFESFSGRGMDGKVIGLDRMQSKIILVTFWAPKGASFGQLTSGITVAQRFNRSDVSAIFISTDPNPEHIQDAFEDLLPGWPLMGDTRGLARRYHVDPNKGATFILDASHRIVATGLTGKALENKIQELLASH
ncbi:MAG: hypothetical protein LAP61_06035 [Acidobacteriia bacterium]|nr:hypothetical protein [Terriglobia bacterium]